MRLQLKYMYANIDNGILLSYNTNEALPRYIANLEYLIWKQIIYIYRLCKIRELVLIRGA